MKITIQPTTIAWELSLEPENQAEEHQLGHISHRIDEIQANIYRHWNVNKISFILMSKNGQA